MCITHLCYFWICEFSTTSLNFFLVCCHADYILVKMRILYFDMILPGRTVVPALRISILPPVGVCWYPKYVCLCIYVCIWIMKTPCCPYAHLYYLGTEVLKVKFISSKFYCEIVFMYNLILVNLYLLNFLMMEILITLCSCRLLGVSFCANIISSTYSQIGYMGNLYPK